MSKKAYKDLTDAEAGLKIHEILNTSKTEDAIKRRIKNELAYPGDIKVAPRQSAAQGMFKLEILAPSGKTLRL